ncbi:hypothetical protein M408DRAFT_332111 [Serendipita vermifera MAFF 305830]|uniref:Uncharacterized protein n=1 Tax=Serendipita vermifera MAFF 305830 TaxID=933852 RepID=A0A0C2X2Y2_SERVB|nr:hypothetical protein M408DRAFT_332111 [Serendipita vermifera MAFF 305830]
MTMNTSTSPKNSGKTSSTNAANDADAPFLGTPYIIDMQRPYEYPFPSPATESCPSLLLPYTHSAPLANAYVSATTPPPPTSLVHRTSTHDGHGHGAHGSTPYPMSGSAISHPPIAFRPSTLLRRRSSHHQPDPFSALSSMPVPIPPRLLSKDSPLIAPNPNNNGRQWRKSRRTDSEGGAVK